MTAQDRSPESPFQIMIVCTGNICRSPAAERLLTTRVGSDVAVRSAGTRAMAGSPIDSMMAGLITAHGGITASFSARQLTGSMLESSDLVLTMTRAHRGEVVELCPRVVRRTFTLKEFARLIEATDHRGLPTGVGDSGRFAFAVPLAAAQRRRVEPPDRDDIVDPYGRRRDVHLTAFDDIQRAISTITKIVGVGTDAKELAE